MANRQATSKFEELHAKAQNDAGDQAERLAEKSLPVPLQALAADVGIRAVRFLPMFSTASLRKAGDGFAVVINTDAPGATEPEGTEIHLNDQRWDGFPVQVRFVVAHEIAHAFFYKALGTRDNSELLDRHWQSLEKSCNHMARMILLPKRALLRLLGANVLNVEIVHGVTKTFAVSPDVLFLRLELDDMRGALQQHNLDGVLMLLRQSDDGMRVDRFKTWGATPTRLWYNPDNKTLDDPSNKLLLSMRFGREVEAAIRSSLADGTTQEFAVSDGVRSQCLVRRLNTGPDTFLVALRFHNV